MEKESFKNLVEEVRDGFVVPAQMKQSGAVGDRTGLPKRIL